MLPMYMTYYPTAIIMLSMYDILPRGTILLPIYMIIYHAQITMLGAIHKYQHILSVQIVHIYRFPP